MTELLWYIAGDWSARMSRKRQTDMKSLLAAIRPLAKQLAAVQAQARALGLFVGDRELLDCPKCGLEEDVEFGGRLITCRPGAPGEDSGLRFKELAGNRFRCPACGAIVREPCPVNSETEPRKN